MRHDYPYYYDKFDDCILRIPGADFFHLVVHVYLQTSNLVCFTVEIATKFLSLMSKIIEMLSNKRGSKKRNFDWAALFSGQITAAKW